MVRQTPQAGADGGRRAGTGGRGALRALDVRRTAADDAVGLRDAGEVHVARIYTPMDAWPAAQLLARTFYAAGASAGGASPAPAAAAPNAEDAPQKKSLLAALQAFAQRAASPSRLLTAAPVGSPEFHARMEQVYATELFLTLCVSC